MRLPLKKKILITVEIIVKKNLIPHVTKTKLKYIYHSIVIISNSTVRNPPIKGGCALLSPFALHQSQQSHVLQVVI